MRARNAILIGVAAFLAFLVAGIPASLLTPLIASHLPPTLQVKASEGTVWQGALTLVKLSRGGAPSRLAWRLRADRLLHAEIAAEMVLSEAHCRIGGVVGRGLAGMSVSEAVGICRAERIAEWIPLLALWQPRGTLSTSGGSLALYSHRAEGRVVVDRIEGEQAIAFDGIGVAQSTLDALGTYRVELAGDGAGMRIKLATRSGPLQLTGEGRYGAPKDIAFTGRALADKADAAALDPLLKLIGPRLPDGSVAIDLKLP